MPTPLLSIFSFYSDLREVFSTRELALYIWIIISLIISLLIKSIRVSFFELAKSFFNYKIIMPILLGALYSLIGVVFLDSIGWWNPSEIKDVIIWILFIQTYTLFIAYKHIKDDTNYYKTAIKENIKLSIVLQFLIDTYTFNLLIEVIIFPITVLVAGMLVVSEKKEEYKKVYRVLNSMLVIYGLYLALYALYHFIVNLNDIVSVDTAQNITLLPFLSIWYLPYLYVFTIYLVYDDAYTIIHTPIKSKWLLLYLKLSGLLSFRLNFKGFERWKSSLSSKRIESVKDVKQSIRAIKEMEMLENNPPYVKSNEGWSPYLAKDFMVTSGLNTSDYKESYDDDWRAASYSKTVKDNSYKNSISYTVIGNKFVAKELKLTLDIFSEEHSALAIGVLINHLQVLYEKSIHDNSKLPTQAIESILNNEDYHHDFIYKELIIKKTIWVKDVYYSIQASIKVKE